MLKAYVGSFLPAFAEDLDEIMAWTDEHFGSPATDRYGALISQALSDLLSEPARGGSRARPDLAPNAYVYHLSFSRKRLSGSRVKSPRHFVLYRQVGDLVEFARLLHDSCDLALHLPTDFEDEEDRPG